MARRKISGGKTVSADKATEATDAHLDGFLDQNLCDRRLEYQGLARFNRQA